MKSLKNVLAIMAFVIGIGAAFGTISDGNNKVATTLYKNDGDCTEVICDINGTGPFCSNYLQDIDASGNCTNSIGVTNLREP